MIDTHLHLNDDLLFDNVLEIISNAKKENVEKFFVVGWDYISSVKAVNLANKYDEIYAMVGFHPENIENVSFSELTKIIDLVNNNKDKVIAIGEIGLDYHWCKEKQKHALQKEWFIKQIELANYLNLPCSIHSRDASEDTYKILKEHQIINNASLHCYSGSVDMMKNFAKLGLYFGFDGPITYKNAIERKECVKACEEDRILIETDSPYLSPTPFRGKTNSPEYLKYILNEIAFLRNISLDEADKITTRNACNLFHVEQ